MPINQFVEVTFNEVIKNITRNNICIYPLLNERSQPDLTAPILLVDKPIELKPFSENYTYVFEIQQGQLVAGSIYVK